MPSINIWCLVTMFYLKKKSCSFDVLKIWKYNFLLVLLADLVRGCGDGMARQRESREGFLCPARGTGHTERDYPPRLREKVIRFDDIPNRKSGMKTVVQDFLARDEALQPQDGSKFIGKSGSKQAGTLGGVSNSLPCIPSIPMYSQT